MSDLRQFDKVIDYIGKHLDEKLSLEQLSEIACFSKYHFHRLFKVYTGLSLSQYIRWLRLKRAAYQLMMDREKSIIEIAIDAGFESHEAFTRAFKQVCGVTPKDFKRAQDGSVWEKPAYCMPKRGENNMKVEVKEMPARRLAVIEHRGHPSGIGESVNKLISWAKAQPMNLKPAPGEAFALAYDDPETTPPEEFRHDLAMTVPENLKLDGEIVEKRLPAGRYAAAMHKGSRDNIAETVYGLYRDWLPQSGEELSDYPCIFAYYNFDNEVAETELLTECWLLLK